MISYCLKEKTISNDRINFVYSGSKQPSKTLARELALSGDGYVRGQYMAEETIAKNGYIVYNRGWISIRDFSRDQLHQVIVDAMESMS